MQKWMGEREKLERQAGRAQEGRKEGKGAMDPGAGERGKCGGGNDGVRDDAGRGGRGGDKGGTGRGRGAESEEEAGRLLVMAHRYNGRLARRHLE